MNKHLRWFLLWWVMLLVGVIARILSPIACFFITRTNVKTTVKRLGKIEATLPRDNLVWWLTWFNTDDNSTDEWWYGCYNTSYTWFGLKFAQRWTQQDYDNSKFIRWFCRVRWLQRNSAYTFNRKFFGIEKDSKWAWQYKADKPLWFGYYNSVNIGYKSHKDLDRLMYAGRVLGIRKVK